VKKRMRKKLRRAATLVSQAVALIAIEALGATAGGLAGRKAMKRHKHRKR
jgi:hypothetical protein